MSLRNWVKTYFNQLTEPMFQRDEQGREYFFPIGFGSRGRAVPDAATGEQLRRRMRQGWIAFFLIWIPVVGASATRIPNTWAFLGVMAVSVGLLWAYALFVARGLPPSERRMTMRNQATSVLSYYSLKGLASMSLLSLALTAVCAFGVFVPATGEGQPSWFRPMTVIGLIFFAATTMMWIWYTVLKWRRG